MKSKTSFFNKGIFWKNVTLYWPLWGLYTLLLFICVPGVMWVASNSWDYTGQLSEKQILDIVGSLPTMLYTIIIACMALCTGCALFSYLFQVKTANMIHSLPVDRNELFGTNVISGLVFLMVPQLVTFAVSVLYCLNRGISHLEYLVAWLFISMITSFVAYSIVTFCSFLTGQMITMIGFVILMNIISFVISGLINYIYYIFAFGFSGTSISQDLVEWCSPLVSFLGLSVRPAYDYENQLYEGMNVVGKDVMLVYSIIAIGLYFLSWVLYKKRHIEHTGDLLTISFLKPVFRWGVGLFAALGVTPTIYYIFEEIDKNIPFAMFVVLFIIIGMLGYWVADMLIKKTFKVFKKTYSLKWGIYSVFLGVTCVGMYLSTIAYENAIPSKEQVAYAKISYGYGCKFEKEELDKVFAIHQAIMEHKDLFENMAQSYHYSHGYDFVSIYYFAQDGSVLTGRDYRIPYNEEGTSIFKTIWEYEKEPKHLLTYLFNEQYERITTFGTGNLEYRKNDKEDTENLEYETIEFDSNAAKVLYEAVIADAYAGTLYEHNSYWRQELYEQEMADKELSETQFESTSDRNKDSQIWISYKLPESQKSQINQNPESISEVTINSSDNTYWKDAGISFGSDCTNIVNALIELGLIASADEIP